MKNFKKTFSFFIWVGLILMLSFYNSCGENETGGGNESNLSVSDAKSFSVNSDEETLSARFEKKNEEIYIYEEEDLGFNLVKKKRVQTTFTLTLIGELLPPSIGGTVLQGTDISASGSKVYLSYNVAGEVKKGAVDLLDLSDKDEPVVISSMTFPSRDINALFYKSDVIYMTGSWEDDSLLSFFSKVSVNGNTFSDLITDIALPGYAGNDIHVTSDEVYVTTGNNAGVFAYDRSDFTETWTLDVANARAVSEYKSKEGPWVLTGEPATLLDINKNGVLEETYQVGGATIPESKSTIETVKKWSLVTRGEEGFSVICSSNGEFLAEKSPPSIDREHEETSVVNAAIVSGDYIYTANGEEGVHVYEMGSKTKTSSCSSFELTHIGYLDFGEGISANHIVASGDYIFVAHGLKGFSVISAEYVDDDDDDD